MTEYGHPPDRGERNTSGRDEPIRVLHVDDDPSMTNLTGTVLERFDDRIEVKSRTDAERGLELLERGEIDCVVSDYEMPEMDGLEFLGAVRRRDPTLPFILFTGKGDEEIASDAIGTGVTDYLQKGRGTDQYAMLANRIRNAVESARREREIARGYRAIESAGEGIAIIDEEGTYRYLNRAYADVYDAEPAEIVGDGWECLYPEREVERFREEILPTLRQKGSWRGEAVARAPDGEEIPEEVTLARLDDGGHVCVVRDLTERKERERELRRERTLLESALDALDDLFYVVSPDRQLVRWNDRVEAVTGYGPEELETMDVLEFFEDEDRKRVEDALREIIEEGAQVSVEAGLVTKEGEGLPYEFIGSPVELEAGTVGVCGIGRARGE